MLLLCVAASCLHASAALKTLYSKVTVKSDNADKGLVYVSTSDKAPASGDYAASKEATHNKFEWTASSAGHTYYLKAKPTDESAYIFKGWYSGNALVSTDPDYTVTVTTSSSDSSKPATQSYTARFIEIPGITLSSNNASGLVTASPEVNHVGDNVTLTAEVAKLTFLGNLNATRHLLLVFDHWEDGDGNILSTEPTFSIFLEAPMEIKGIFKDLSEVPQTGKYYRIRNMVNRVLTIEGRYAMNTTDDKDPAGGQGMMAQPSLMRWTLPEGHVFADFYTAGFGGSSNRYDGTDDVVPLDVTTMPSTIFYIDGKQGSTGVTGVAFRSQGQDTKTLMDKTLAINPMSSATPGYYYVNGEGFLSTACIKMRGRYLDNVPYCDVYVGSASDTDTYSAMAFQALDEEHMDYFWFGAKPDEALEYEGGYWTSMYTAFPYECRDGVEAYYVKESTTSNGQGYAMLTLIEDGRVPENTAVLLKCQGLTSKENRLLPLAPGSVPAITGNALKGEYQLYEDRNYNGRINFDESTMRVLGINSRGEIGFYKLAATAEGTPVQLLANKAYLDITLLPSAAAASYKIAPAATDGITDIEADDTPVNLDLNPVYDLQGRRVTNPEPGNVYIINGAKVLWK